MTVWPTGVVSAKVTTPAEAAVVASYADAVVVGSALVRLIESKAGDADLVATFGETVRALKDATRRTTGDQRSLVAGR